MAYNVHRRTLLKGLAATTALTALPSLRARAQSDTIKIGYVAPLSGGAQIVGQPGLFGAQTAVEQINAKGGINGKMLELVVRDDKGDPTQSVAAVRELVGDGVNLIAGVPLTATALAVSGIIESVDGVYIATGTGDESLTHDLFTPHFFTAAVGNYVRNSAGAKVMADKYPDVTTWTGIIPDISIGHGSWERMAAGLKEHYAAAGKEITILDPIVAKYGSTDFKNQIVQLMASPATGLHSVLFGNDGVTFFQQASQFGLDKKFQAITEQALDLDLPKAMKQNMPQNTWTFSFWNPAAYPDSAEAQALLAAYKEKEGNEHPHAFSSLSHTAIKAYAAALEKTGGDTDTAKIIDALENVQIDSVTGPAYFRKEDHQIINSGTYFNAVGADNPDGYELKDIVVVDYGPITPPPAPGEKFTF
jgi:branched-chain amino acid transport system substrate-binding protein